MRERSESSLLVTPQLESPRSWTHDMSYMQIMEFEMDPADAVAFIEEYRESAAGQSFARRAIVCADRDQPGTVVQIMFFDSAADAEANNNLEITQAAAAEFSARVGEVRFQNLDLVADITV